MTRRVIPLPVVCPQQQSLVNALFSCSTSVHAAVKAFNIAFDAEDFAQIACIRQEVRVLREHMRALRQEMKAHRAEHGC
jgi:hypothetical protein